MNIEKRIEELEARGFKRWTKGNFDRLYISIEKLQETAEKNDIDFSPSRQIRNFGKVWIDVNDGELHMDNLTDWNKADVKKIIDVLMN